MKCLRVLTLLAIAALLLFPLGCRKQENVNTDTAAVDTAITSTGPTTTDTTGVVSTVGTTGTPTMTETTVTTGTIGATGTTATTDTTTTKK